MSFNSPLIPSSPSEAIPTCSSAIHFLRSLKMSRLAASLSLTFTFLSLISATTQIALPGSESYKQCKPHPHGQGWPKTAQWSSLNHTVGGRLLAPLPPAVVCDHDRPQYNEESCNLLASTWFQSNFHASDPISVDWPNWQGDGCLPSIFGNASIKCDTKPFPAYVVAAEKKEDVAAAVKFAARTGVRLVVKGTGHDFLGR